jgi:hypothetical protein
MNANKQTMQMQKMPLPKSFPAKYKVCKHILSMHIVRIVYSSNTKYLYLPIVAKNATAKKDI